VHGYVLDRANADIILFGTVDANAPALYTEDFVVALRSAWLRYAERRGNTYYYTPPGCSIDPRSEVIRKLQQVGHELQRAPTPAATVQSLTEWGRVCRLPQGVRVLGVPHSSRFAAVAVLADAHLKRVVDGTETVDGLSSLTERRLKSFEQDFRAGRAASAFLSSMNRFWFHTGEHRFLRDTDIVWLEQLPVRLSTEAQLLGESGSVDTRGPPDPLAERFASAFSERFEAIASTAKGRRYRELESLFRFVALAQALRHEAAERTLGLGYLLDVYRVPATSVPKELPGHANVGYWEHSTGNRQVNVQLPSCGGVDMHVEVGESSFRQDLRLTPVMSAALASRPYITALFWNMYHS
jgi:hypothetical protein